MTSWVSEREATRMLLPVCAYRNAAVRVLHSGAAGVPTRTSTATLYDAGQVHALLTRRMVDDLPTPTDHAFLEVRVAPNAHGWRDLGNASALVKLHFSTLIERHGLLAVVLTCGGFVLSGAEAVDAVRTRPDTLRLATRPPGGWFDGFGDRRLPTTRGNPWLLWLDGQPGPRPTSGQLPPK